MENDRNVVVVAGHADDSDRRSWLEQDRIVSFLFQERTNPQDGLELHHW